MTKPFDNRELRAEAQDIAAFLNHHYFTPMAEIIHQHNGTMDKHIGIGISTGKVFSGILGSIRKREFTLIGMAK